MRKLNTHDFGRMVVLEEDTFDDVINITNRTPYRVHGETLYSGVVQSGVDCGFNFTGDMKVDKGIVVTSDYDAEVRLALDVDIDINDLVTLVSKATVTYSGYDFIAFEHPRYGEAEQRIRLKRQGS